MEWYPTVAKNGWLALTHDKGQLRNSDERDAAMRAGVALFIIVGRMTHAELADFVARMAHKITAFRERHDAPFIAKIHRRELHKMGTHMTKPGRIEMALTYKDWEAGLARTTRKKGK